MPFWGLRKYFNTHTPHGVRQILRKILVQYSFISTHTPHTGCDALGGNSDLTIVDFNSHTPHGVRPLPILSSLITVIFQLTHPTRGATRNRNYYADSSKFQLTHPTRGATSQGRRSLTCLIISTHTPHTGCDLQMHCICRQCL